MKLRKRLTHVFGRDREADAPPPAAAAGSEEQADAVDATAADSERANQAERYGVSIEPVHTQNADRHWKVRRVRHLTPEENNGQHHIFVQAHFQENSPHDEARVFIQWEDGSQELTLGKNQRESYLSFAMFTWQICRVSMKDAPSDLVAGLTANHPDELTEEGARTGNTLFHHSFLVEFEEMIAPQNNSQIYGQVVNGEQLRLVLVKDEEVLGSGGIPPSGAFRFNSVPAGAYLVQVVDPATNETKAQSDVIELDGIASVEVNLEIEGPEPPMEEAPAAQPAPRAAESLPPTPPAAQPSAPAMQTETPTSLPPPETRAQPESSEPSLAAAGFAKTIEHYVLFGPREHFATRVYLPLLTNQLLEANVTFGFNPQEAFHAKRVTILASPDVLPTDLDASYLAQGIAVQRVHGDLERIKAVIKA